MMYESHTKYVHLTIPIRFPSDDKDVIQELFADTRTAEKNTRGYPFSEHSPKLNFIDSNPFVPSYMDKELIHKQPCLSNKRYQSTGYDSNLFGGGITDFNTDLFGGSIFDVSEHGENNIGVEHLLNGFRESKNQSSRRNVSVQSFTHTDGYPLKQKHSSGDFSAFFYGQSGDNIFFPRDDVYKEHVPPPMGSRSRILAHFSPLLCYEKMDVDQHKEDKPQFLLKERSEDQLPETVEACKLLEMNEKRSEQRFLFASQSAGGDNLSGGTGSQGAHWSQGSNCTSNSSQVHGRVPEFMPSFHGNYYSDHISNQDLVWPHGDPEMKVEGMDMLDLIDRDVHTDSKGDRCAPTETGHRGMSGHQPHACCLKSLLQLPSDSPIERTMYPRKMY